MPTLVEVWSVFDHSVPSDKNEWDLFCFGIDSKSRKNFYELLTVEFIDAFSRYLHLRAKGLGASAGKPIRVLEVGGGNGRLAHFTRLMLDDSVEYIVTDSGKYGYSHEFPHEQMDLLDILCQK
ncbi:MAG: hypothetical protein A3F31_00915 [Candidatus Levybacteria bacterium RIFCSPHIGHO2_12_FULL_38_12]|nr:MAG: hypothetical protein A2770_01545 [Candidatus Levybacteria bacterium RIFCSPHIGHO2_01_FULL_38_12]OGH21981.1 MAG: hypothetical protein A3D75_03075 [Candidatus Levybacteria bacterium RIFCSPHIGHO2_02_FULL_37_18]OGH23052.1 MAG: hypothetical protein A3F31_00915 [Candidatus Levybacteria bacterium RIFCSPHIGHO2_12_FULL_38_12]OGH33674.1 MAG: hypothetical protein A3A47_02510 [Candidatus Levybacteria bacterium RIFCSPLOWO2_01_FULL_37_20]OGH44580.1 MAG: hypothetical protein A3J14_00595 [Candidatus Lev